MSIKLLIGGSPCTNWSIAQKNNRETTAEGIGWELFKNYLIAKEKFKPDFFLYENNKSAAQPIKDQIAQELGVGSDPQARFTYINSALVSAQNRQRFYVTNFGDIEQPEDRGILLKDILETGNTVHDKSPTQTAQSANPAASSQVMMVQPVNVTPDGKSQTIKAQYQRNSARNICCYDSTYGATGVAEPVMLNDINGKAGTIRATCYKDGTRNLVGNNVDKRTCVAEPVCVAQRGRYAEPVRVGSLPRPNGELSTSQAMQIYSQESKSTTKMANGGGQGAKTGLYAIPVDYSLAELSDEYYHGDKDGQLLGKIVCKNTSNNKGQPAQGTRVYKTDCKSICLDGDSRKYIIDAFAIPTEFVGGAPVKAVSCADGKEYPVYEVRKGYITIKDKQYPIKLADGYYIIRKLTVTECCRLQTMPDDYCKAVSATQAYKGLGNGWTAEVIIHLLNHVLKDVPRDTEIIVLSLYDGIGTGRYCLEKMGFTNVTYHAYEIDKYPIQIAMDNYPDIIQHGDAFAVREDTWKPPQSRSDWLDELLGGKT